MEARAFLEALAMVLCVAAVTTVLFQWMRQPVVLGYVVGGLIVGPHVQLPLVADPEIVHTLSELGVILLLFSLGLEFDLRKLVRLGSSTALTTVIEVSATAWLGFSAARLLGWSTLHCLYAGAVVAISSTTIVVKSFEDRQVRGTVRDTVLGILIVEDLLAILIMAVMTAVSRGSGLDAADLALTSLRLAGFLVGLIVVGLLVVPRAIRAIERLNRPETTLIASIGICFATALLARKMGYALALGAFVAGALVAESGDTRRIQPLVRPIRDLFVAVFFVSVGMSIDPQAIMERWPLVLLFTVVVVLGKVCGVTLGAFLMGHGVRNSVQTGMSLAQIGELSFVIAGIGVAFGAIPGWIYSIAIAVSALTTLFTPWFIRLSGPVAALVDRRLPHPLQTFAALYGTWVEKLRTAPHQARRSSTVVRCLRLLALDASLVLAIVVGATVARSRILVALQGADLSPALVNALLTVVMLLMALPFAVGIVRLAQRLGFQLGLLAMPAAPAGKLDLAAAPRQALVVTLQIAIVLVVGLPLVLVMQPFVNGLVAMAVLLVLVLVLGFVFHRSTTNLQGHVRAGAELIAEALLSHARATGAPTDKALSEIQNLLPGMGTPILLQLAPTSAAMGRTLAEINLRGRTGATVLAIVRADRALLPGADDSLAAGDVLAMTGTQEAITAATALLQAGSP